MNDGSLFGNGAGPPAARILPDKTAPSTLHHAADEESGPFEKEKQKLEKLPSYVQRRRDGNSASSRAPPPRKISGFGFGKRGRSSLLSIPEDAAAATTATSSSRPKLSKSSSQFFESNKNLRLSVLPLSGYAPSSSRRLLDATPELQEHLMHSPLRQQSSDSLSLEDDQPSKLTPTRLMELENGASMPVSDVSFLPRSRYDEAKNAPGDVSPSVTPIAKENDIFFVERGSSLEDRINNGDVRDFEVNDEVGVLGGAWRGALRRLIVWSYDRVNALRLTRALQIFLPFLTGYEAYVTDQLIEALENGRKRDIKYVLAIAFQNRNVSRILVQQMGPRFDFLWHWSTMATWNRPFDAWGQFPIVGVTGFPATENFPSTRDHALASIFRVVLGQGNWVTRVVTRGREGLITDNPNNTAQNLTAESNGFELANRNQYGTYVGRIKTNEFRLAHRLPTDESIVRTFVAQPMPTMLNNGVVHVLRQLAKHWHNMLRQQNFAHQRMEQLDPFEALRFHMPVVLLTLASLRGRNHWDSQVLGPVIRELQGLTPAFTADEARLLARKLRTTIAVNVCGGVASVVDPFVAWVNAIEMACDGIEEEAKEVYDIVASVEVGIRLGHDLITQISWKVPSNEELKHAIVQHIHGLSTGNVDESRIRIAMTKITPRDMRTLFELVKTGLGNSKPAQMLLGRAMTLLQRELRRQHLNEGIRELSVGAELSTADLKHDEWYWLEENGEADVYIYDSKVTGREQYRFVDVLTKTERFEAFTDGQVKLKAYIPVAESISRAQRAFMNIELDHGKRYSYNAFMEFSYLRTALRRLIVISEATCEALDNARLNVLEEIHRSNQTEVSVPELEPGNQYFSWDPISDEFVPFTCTKQYTKSDPEWDSLSRSRIVKVPPQSMIVIGGGPTGLMTGIHCLENVLASGGDMNLYESRDSFARGASTFERAQIVRLDARWIAMLRYHLGTGFEDVFIPASGETDSQLGNTLPTQGFVEITIKDLENMLHSVVSQMWSKGLVRVHTDSHMKFDHETNALTKTGEHLKLEDKILRRVDENGRLSTQSHSWKVVDLIYVQPLSISELRVGHEYGIYIRAEDALVSFKLVGVDIESSSYSFKALDEDHRDLNVMPADFPSVYPKGRSRHVEVDKIVVKCMKKGSKEMHVHTTLPMKIVRNQKFTMDVGHSHVVEAIGKSHGSRVHFSATTYEPYGVCCIQGLKISMGMHNFGEKRWGSGLLDDLRSQNDQNTRIIGDFTKMVRSAPVAKKMLEYMTDPKDKNWQMHFHELVKSSGFPELNDFDPVIPKIQTACRAFAKAAHTFKRQTLQTRFFETGDNYYLGMELTREYDTWKNNLAEDLVSPLSLKAKTDVVKTKISQLKSTLMHHIDRLWYEGVLEVIRTGDVYNPGARHRVPRLFLINSYAETNLGSLPVGESFRLSDSSEELYEVVDKRNLQTVVRDVEGRISKMRKSTLVRREGNLTRSPDGNAESRVSLATFPVGHYVNFRTMRLNDAEKGYAFAFIGDEQATPHFMRYSGLTGACINAMMFNTFIKQAIDGVPLVERFRLYSQDTNWSNGEVVQRGTGGNYGEDGFLRPGFPYAHLIDYLHSKVIEYQESKQDLDNVLSRDWKVKIAASIVPRGMELNEEFISALYQQLQAAIFDKLVVEVATDKSLNGGLVGTALKARTRAMIAERQTLDYESYWEEFGVGLRLDEQTKQTLENGEVAIAVRLEQTCSQVVDFAKQAHLYNERVSSELSNQPKPVDSIVDDFAVEAQNFANALTMSAAFASGVLAFRLVGDGIADLASALLAVLNILISFGTMTNSARYKIRNEEARVHFADEKLSGTMKGVFSLMDSQAQKAVPWEQNPFAIDLEEQVDSFLESVKYYDAPDPQEFNDAYSVLKVNINDPSAIRAFQQLLTTKFIVDTYHVNSYIQEHLVNIYKSLDEIYQMLVEDTDRGSTTNGARRLFDRLIAFHPRLEGTLQRGPTRYGFVKERKLSQWDITVVFKYAWSLICCASPKKPSACTPVSTETLGIVRETKILARHEKSQILRREIRDLDALYKATCESDIGSLVFTSAFLVFMASIIFSVARAFSVEVLEKVAYWAVAASALGAVLATFHLWRKLWILFRLVATLVGKASEAQSTEDRLNIRKVLGVTITQVLLTVMRLISAGAASVALPWSVAENGYHNRINTHERLPFWIALGAVGMAVVSTLFFFVVEYVIRYNLSPKLGEFVCESFRDEIEALYSVFARPVNDIETKQVQERETWEYVAREFLHRYRFDAVFAADRFGNILQYIQSGMDPRE